jgi:hypothetical protein
MGMKSFWRRIAGKKEPSQNDQSAEIESETNLEWEPEDLFAVTFGVELFFKEMPGAFPSEQIKRRMTAFCGDVDMPGDSQESMLFFFKQHTVKFATGEMPVQVFVAKAGEGESNTDYEPSLRQSWQFRHVREVVAACPHRILVTDMMASGLEIHQRITLFQAALYVIVEALRPDAIHFMRSQLFIESEAYLANVPKSPSYDRLLGPLNVRLFKVEDDRESAVVMDTLGLSALGLPDLQIHCRDLDVNQLAGMLYGTGHYVFDNGDVIQDGNTLSGWEENQRWKCRHEASLAEPRRVVVDINPGEPWSVR